MAGINPVGFLGKPLTRRNLRAVLAAA